MRKYCTTLSFGLLVLGIMYMPYAYSPAALAQSGTGCHMLSKNLALGSKSSDVAALQTWLVANGFDIPAVISGHAKKGYFGPETAEALKKYQAASGIPATGYFGRLTQAKINSENTCASAVTATTSLPQADAVTTAAAQSSLGADSMGEMSCGSQTYANPADAIQGTASSSCFSERFNTCRPATYTVSIAGQETIGYEIVGTSSAMCKVSETITIPALSEPEVLSCLFDDTKSFSVAGQDASACSPQ